MPVKSGEGPAFRKNKFAQFADHASRLNQGKHGKHGRAPTSTASNPYASTGTANPYGSAPGDVYGQNTVPKGNYSSRKNPYESDLNVSSRPGQVPAGYTQPSYSQPNFLTESSSSSSSPYAAAAYSYASRFGDQGLQRTETQDSELVTKRNELFRGATRAAAATGTAATSPPPENQHSGYNSSYPSQEQAQVEEEDEDIEQIKGQIRFTKQESVNSTRNALRLAAEAEESGRNTLGMLGSQGELIANTESSLALAATQNKIAEEKARELKAVSGSIFKPHVSNPFNSRRKEEEKEAMIKQQKQQEQVARENRRQIAYESQQRVMGGLSGSGPSETAQKYRNQQRSGTAERQKYQFEADSEDEDLENEIDSNLDALYDVSGRLKKLALSTNEEVTRQNERLDNIANQTDDLDVNVHLNTSRLANIK